MTDCKILHILNKPPNHPRFAQCLNSMGKDDILLLTENGVLGLTQALEPSVDQVLALASDCTARGIAGVQESQLIDFKTMVTLSASAERVISW